MDNYRINGELRKVSLSMNNLEKTSFFSLIYSEYRAKLYSRLEGKRKKRELREIKEQVKPLEERKNIMAGSVSEQPKFKLPVKRKPLVARTTNKKRRTKRRTPRLQKGQSTIKRNDSKSSVPPELLSRLPAALQEINRRILVQNFLWLALQLDWNKNSFIGSHVQKFSKFYLKTGRWMQGSFAAETTKWCQ